MPINEIKRHGKHDLLNALAVLALSDAINLPREIALQAIKQFPGLSHRCQLVKTTNHVRWINDSKATNVGAAVAAIESLTDCKNIILIAGGVGKSADFLPLRPAIKKHVKSLLLIGEAAQQIASCCQGAAPIMYFDSLSNAVAYAKNIAKPYDNVLLSPACASFDMFDNFEHRGETFINLVKNNESR